MVKSKSASDKTILISSIESDNVGPRNFCFCDQWILADIENFRFAKQSF